MSVYRDTNATVVFEHPHEGPLTAVVYREGVVLPTYIPTDPVEPTAGRFVLALPWQATQYDGKLTVEWSAEGFIRQQTVQVVTPLVSLSKLQTIFEDEVKSTEELSELEQTVRVFIEAYVGQSFGNFIGTRMFAGSGGNRISLDQRLNRLTGFSGGWPGYLKISSDGWALTVVPDSYLTIKQAPPEELISNTVVVEGVIHVPSPYIKRFNTGATYSVTGEWGYDVVPDEVQEAAMLLANDFSCNEITYRDRYLQSIKIQQDTITYHPGAFRGTGNARADLLLAKFRRTGMAII